ELEACASWLADTLRDIPVGQTVVYLDGWYFDIDETPGAYEGLYAAHELQRLPHFEALSRPEALRATLGERSYWVTRDAPLPTHPPVTSGPGLYRPPMNTEPADPPEAVVFIGPRHKAGDDGEENGWVAGLVPLGTPPQQAADGQGADAGDYRQAPRDERH